MPVITATSGYPTTNALRPNEIFGSIYNMIISQSVHDPDVDIDDFVEQFRV